MVEGKKISELNLAQTLNEGCCFPILSNGATKRVTFAILLENILTQLTLPENQELKQLKEKVNLLDKSIDLTDKEIEEIKKQFEEIQKDVNSQDEIIVKYIKFFEDLKTVYDKATISGGVVDSALNENSINPVQNQVLAKIIPAQANEENKLADKDFVNSSIATNTAEFIGTFNSLEELQNTDKSFDNNDYGFVIETDKNGNSSYERYKWNGSEWVFEYTLNNSSFTSEQWAAIQSGITAELVALIGRLDNPIDDSTCDIGHTWSSEKIFNMIKEYSRKQNLLSDIETITLTETDTEMPYDGFVSVYWRSSAGLSDKNLIINDVNVGGETSVQGTTSYVNAGTISYLVKQGDRVRVDSTSALYSVTARWYKERDYGGR